MVKVGFDINYIAKEVLKFFKKKSSFTREELYKQFLKFEPELKAGTFGWRIYEFKRQNLIREIGSGLYSCDIKQDYTENIKHFIKNSINKNELLFFQQNPFFKIIDAFNHIFIEDDFCIWNTNWLNEFTDLQLTKNTIILEVGKNIEETLFYFIKDNISENVLLKPNYDMIEKYSNQNTIIIKNLISRSPFKEFDFNVYQIRIPRLEKILVDIKADRNIFHYLSNHEIDNILNRSNSKYNLKYSLLINYALRRAQIPEDYIKFKNI